MRKIIPKKILKKVAEKNSLDPLLKWCDENTEEFEDGSVNINISLFKKYNKRTKVMSIN